MAAAIEVKDLVKSYGNIKAVDRVTFSIEEGEIFGLLGPNGAGKTTTLEMVEGLRKPDGGSIRVCNVDVTREAGKVKEIIGVQLQSTSIYSRIKVGEVIDLFAGYYPKALTANAILGQVALEEKKGSFVEALSGGQKQRLAMALALVNDPKVLFLDEPTTALDPQARHNVWDIIESLSRQGKTIVLNTHYMEEAERLCERVGIMDHGRIVALDTPANLIAKRNLDSVVEFSSLNGTSKEFYAQLPGVNSVTQNGNQFFLYTGEASALLTDLIHLNEQHRIHVNNLSTRSATLEDVFLNLTGRNLRE